MAGLGEWLDDARARGVAEAAVVIGHAGLKHLGKVIAHEMFLIGGKFEWIGIGQLLGNLARELFGIGAARREN